MEPWNSYLSNVSSIAHRCGSKLSSDAWDVLDTCLTSNWAKALASECLLLEQNGLLQAHRFEFDEAGVRAEYQHPGRSFVDLEAARISAAVAAAAPGLEAFRRGSSPVVGHGTAAGNATAGTEGRTQQCPSEASAHPRIARKCTMSLWHLRDCAKATGDLVIVFGRKLWGELWRWIGFATISPISCESFSTLQSWGHLSIRSTAALYVATHWRWSLLWPVALDGLVGRRFSGPGGRKQVTVASFVAEVAGTCHLCWNLLTVFGAKYATRASLKGIEKGTGRRDCINWVGWEFCRNASGFKGCLLLTAFGKRAPKRLAPVLHLWLSTIAEMQACIGRGEKRKAEWGLNDQLSAGSNVHQCPQRTFCRLGTFSD